MSTKMKFEVKNIYGRLLYYPKCQRSRALCKIMRVDTLSHEKIQLLMDAGFEVDEIKNEQGTV